MEYGISKTNHQSTRLEGMQVKECAEVVLRRVDGGNYLKSELDDHELKSIVMVDPVVMYNVD